MLKKLKILIEDIKLIKEGNSFKDKFTIGWYVLTLPFNYFLILFRKRLSNSLIFDVIIKNKDGMFFCKKDIGLIKTISPSYEKDLRGYFNLDKGTFIDIGANIGKYTIMVGKKVRKNGKVLAIEPEEENYKLLLQNIKINNLTNITPLKLACLNKDIKLKLYLKDNDRGGHSIKEQFGGKYQKVKGQKLDTIIKNLKIEKVDLIKVDAEGAEPEVLNGASKILSKSHPKIIFESRGRKKHLQEIKKILNSFDYKIKKVDARNYFAS